MLCYQMVAATNREAPITKARRAAACKLNIHAYTGYNVCCFFILVSKHLFLIRRWLHHLKKKTQHTIIAREQCCSCYSDSFFPSSSFLSRSLVYRRIACPTLYTFRAIRVEKLLRMAHSHCAKNFPIDFNASPVFV